MKKILIFVALAALLVGLPFISKLTRGTDAKQVEVQKVELKLIKSSILASGTLAYREQVQLRSEVIGQVIELHVEEADQVKKGALVITPGDRADRHRCPDRRVQRWCGPPHRHRQRRAVEPGSDQLR